MTAGIVGYGAYIPRYRLKTEDVAKVWQGRGSVREKAVPGLDEDVITMAVEAAQRALAHAAVAPSDIGAVYLASVSSPYIVKSSAAIVAEVLDIPASASCADFGGSTRAISQALQACLDAVLAKRIKYGLVVGADILAPEPSNHLEGIFGAGAGAVIIGDKNLLAELSNTASHTSDFTSVWQSNKDRWMRRHDDPRLDQVFGYPVATGSAVKALLQSIEEPVTEVSQVVSYLAEPNASGQIARQIGVAPDKISNTGLVRDIGDAGNGALLLGLASALDQAPVRTKILAISYGSGAGADAFGVTTTPALARRRNGGSVAKQLVDKKYIDYVTYSKHIGVFNMFWLADPWSSYVAQPQWTRNLEYDLKLKGTKCKKCGALNYPQHFYCLDCRSTDLEIAPVPRRGHIVTYNIQHIAAVAPEEMPCPVCVAKMDGVKGKWAGKISAMITDSELDDVKIGAPVELVFRRGGMELNLVRYGYKFKVVKG